MVKINIRKTLSESVLCPETPTIRKIPVGLADFIDTRLLVLDWIVCDAKVNPWVLVCGLGVVPEIFEVALSELYESKMI